MSNCNLGTQSLFLDLDAMVAGILRWLLIFTVSGMAAVAQVPQSHSFDLPGEVPALESQAESSRANIAIMGVRISSDFDDNALNSQQDRQSDFALFLQPRVGWHVSGSRLDWMSDYTLGLSRSQKFAAYDSLSHLLDSQLQVRLTRRLRLVIREAYLNSSNPFDQLQAFESATSSPARVVPSETTALSPAQVRTDQSTADVAYALSSHSTVGVGGEFFGANYNLASSRSASGQMLQNASSSIGHSYYTRQITRHQWTGLYYQLQKSTFNKSQSSSLVHSLKYTHTITLLDVTTISLFVGPERSVPQNITGTLFSPQVSSGAQSAWHWSGGMTGRWTGKRMVASVGLSKKIDSGGLLGTTERTTGSAEMAHQFGLRWTTKLIASYDRYAELAGTGTLSSFSIAGSLTHALSPSLSLELQYWRVDMSGNEFLPAGLLADHNRVLMSIVYEHKQALGR